MELDKNIIDALLFLDNAPQVEVNFMDVPVDYFSRLDLIRILKYRAYRDLEDSYKF